MVAILAIGVLLAACLSGYVVFILIASYHVSQNQTLSDQLVVFPAITVVVAARNEAGSIMPLLESLCQQDYPLELWEVIIVDDNSEDRTAEIVKEFTENQELSNFSLITSNRSGKKAAIETGVERARGEWILQTDADCVAGEHWISAMVGSIRDGIRFVSGPIRMCPGNSWLERLQALEMLGLVTLGAGSMVAGFPNMANGANMAYHRQTFLDLGGFGSSIEIASGDDEFLVQSIHQRFPGSLTFAMETAAIIDTSTISTWKEFKNQRIRWVSKARSYINKSTNLIQLMAWLGFFSFPWWCGIALFDIRFLPVPVGLFLAKLLADRWLMVSGALFLQRTRWLRWLLLLEIVYIPYVIWIGIRGNLSNSYIWKDRKTT